MTEILKGDLFALRRAVRALRSLIRIGPESVTQDGQAVSCSPRILQEIRTLRRAGIRSERKLLGNSRDDRALPYSSCPQFIPSRTGLGAGAKTVPPAVRFNVIDADETLLQFLGKQAVGFHVFELRCAGFEKLWRDDLSKVVEMRQAVHARMTIYAANEPVELEHLACPLLESGRIVEIRGWFDEARGRSMPSIDWTTVRQVRRSKRPHPIEIKYR